jgi:hypothetical protein
MALGALIIKEKLGISDRETVEQNRENPYLLQQALCKLNSEFGMRGEHMAGKDFKVLQIPEARVCHQLMSRKVK